MSMKPVLSVVVLGVVVACGGSKEVTTELPDPPIFCVRSIFVTPASANLMAGDSLRLTGSSGGGGCGMPALTTWLWRSANPSIASVGTETGVVRAIGQGVTTITAVASSDTTVRAAAVIAVVFDIEPLITINTVSYVSNGRPANLDSLAGVIEVAATTDRRSTGSQTVELVIQRGADTVVATSTTPTPAPDNYRHVLRWNTDARDAAGSRLFANGAAQFRLRFRESASPLVVNGATYHATLKNP